MRRVAVVRISEDCAGPRDRSAVDATFRRAFDQLCEHGYEAMRTGSHGQDAPPVDGGRWGLSVIARLDQAAGGRLDHWARRVGAFAGGKHWRTGAAGSAHVTVRAIQPHRAGLGARDPFVTRCAAATVRAATGAGPVVFEVRGLAVSSACVMACLYPVDDLAGRLAGAVRREFGPDDGWLEESYTSTIWYSSLLHFTTGIDDAVGLVRWVRAHRYVDPMRAVATCVQLATFDYDGYRMIPRALADVELARPPARRLRV